MDQTMPLKLPRYVFRRANGSFRYKRNVPKDLRTVIPRATVYRQLGNTYQDALRALPKVHAEIEALFDLERRTTDEQRARALVRERLGEYGFEVFFFCICSIVSNSPRVFPSGKPGAVQTARSRPPQPRWVSGSSSTIGR